MSEQMKSANRRALLSGIIGDYSSDIDELSLVHPYNMCGLTFGEWFARIIKIVELDEDNLPKYPKIIRRAILKALHEDDLEEQTQMQLAGFENEIEDTEYKFDLGKMKQAIIGYIVGHNDLITGFVFAEYVDSESQLQNIFYLDLESGTQMIDNLSSSEFDPSEPSTTIKLKPSHTPSPAHEDEA